MYRGHGFAAGLEKTHALGTRNRRRQRRRYFYFQRMRIAENRAAFQLPAQGLIHRGKTVPQGDWPQTVAQVDVFVAIQIPHPATFAPDNKTGLLSAQMRPRRFGMGLGTHGNIVRGALVELPRLLHAAHLGAYPFSFSCFHPLPPPATLHRPLRATAGRRCSTG